MTVPFIPFPKIQNVGKLHMHITQKIHGTNAHIYIEETSVNDPADFYDEENSKNYHVRVGSRTRWITPTDDNYGFATFVHKHLAEFVKRLGPGHHFGEWAGLGINSGEGLTSKVFVLFDFWKWPSERQLPPGTVVVPVLYNGMLDITQIEAAMTKLRTEGSQLTPGFMRPEGVVVSIGGTRYKKVFDAETTQWKKGDELAARLKLETQDASRQFIHTNYGHLFQPIRLEKLLSRDEAYIRDLPKSLPLIVNAYWDDLVAEGEISGALEELAAIKKLISGELFKFVRTNSPF